MLVVNIINGSSRIKVLNASASQEKLFSSHNRTEASVGKKLKGDMLLEIEKVHKVNTDC